MITAAGEYCEKIASIVRPSIFRKAFPYRSHRMLIRELLKVKKPLLSFEIFPPKASYQVNTIFETIDELYVLKPDFISVTYGAGGSLKGKTIDIASYIHEKHQLSALAHLTCLGSTRAEIEHALQILEEKGVRNILALRGDYPEGTQEADFENRAYRHAIDLIEHIRETAGNKVSIGAACYPETHIQATDRVSDLRNLKSKVDAGVDFLITQLFFDNEQFYDFKEKTEILGINVPIITGVMPVLNKNQIQRIVALSGCTLPKKFLRIMDKYEYQPEALKDAGIAYATEQVIDLLSAGVAGVHIYTMNKPVTAREIMKSISTIRGFLTEEQS